MIDHPLLFDYLTAAVAIEAFSCGLSRDKLSRKEKSP
jgi:hypothetical protein